MADLKQRLGAIASSSSGMAAQAARKIEDSKKKKKSRLDSIMSEMQSSRKQKTK